MTEEVLAEGTGLPLLGRKAPDFEAETTQGTLRLSDYKGRWLVLYFYPKDNTKGCTLEAVDFTLSLGDFDAMNADVIGVSPDSIKSHQNFCIKNDLKVTLISDPEHEVLKKYGVWQLKKMYGREYYGVVRSTFLIDPDGIIAHIWSKVRVKGHVEAVKQKLSEIQEQM